MHEEHSERDPVRGARGLYAIVDPERAELDPIALTEAILRGGCALLQLRAKSLSDREQLGLARAIRARCAAAGVPFFLNDRPDLALLAGADGLHLGQTDLPLAEAREIVGEMPIGLSTHTEAQLRGALAQGPELLAFGPIFPTASKADPDPVVGLEGLRRAAALCAGAGESPLIAIGGMSLARAKEAARCGARLVAVISALSGPDPEGVEARARALHQGILEELKEARGEGPPGGLR